MPCAKDQFKTFREKRRKIPDILSLYRKKEHQNGEARQMNSLKRRFGDQGGFRSAE